MFYNSGVHNLQDLMPDDLGWSRCNNKKNEVYKKVTCLNHPETIGHPLLHRKIFFHKACPWCQKGWGLLLEDNIGGTLNDAGYGVAFLDPTPETDHERNT